jgi:hypothetical protein
MRHGFWRALDTLAVGTRVYHADDNENDHADIGMVHEAVDEHHYRVEWSRNTDRQNGIFEREDLIGEYDAEAVELFGP